MAKTRTKVLAIYITSFSCPGSSSPTLGGASLEFGHGDCDLWDLSEIWSESDKNTKGQKDNFFLRRWPFKVKTFEKTKMKMKKMQKRQKKRDRNIQLRPRGEFSIVMWGQFRTPMIFSKNIWTGQTMFVVLVLYSHTWSCHESPAHLILSNRFLASAESFFGGEGGGAWLWVSQTM